MDAGKTTLSEALLYRAGAVRKLGRVDHGDAFLDTDAIERERGITIFTEPAVLQLDGTAATTEIHNNKAQTDPSAPQHPHDPFQDDPLQVTLLDTPGHTDFSAEMERALTALDYAVLVVSATDGIQGHTETLWRLLKRYDVPTFIFVNKIDMPGADRDALLTQLRSRFGDALVDGQALLNAEPSPTLEDAAVLSEQAMDEYMDAGSISLPTLQSMIADRTMFPVFFGSALRLEGIDEFMHAFSQLVREPVYPAEFGARVIRISHDASGARLTWLKITGGELSAKTMLDLRNVHGEPVREKVDQVRAYSGAKYTTVERVGAGQVAAVTGLTATFPGQGLGFEPPALPPMLQPVLSYTLLPGDEDVHRCLTALRTLGDEDPMLHVLWQPQLEEIHVQLMGAVQLEVVEQLLRTRFHLDVSFGPGSILYKETIAEPQEGMGHFEPLRHYAEAHILLEPLGSESADGSSAPAAPVVAQAPSSPGIAVASAVPEDELDRNWQRLILSYCVEREHLGVLTGAPLTNVKFTLVAGRAHLKHTEGGDFRQATYRAIRQGLMELKARGACVLLEPWYRFEIEVPQENVGRAMADVQRMGGSFGAADLDMGEGTAAASSPSDSSAAADGMVCVRGTAPAAGLRDYAMDVMQYTHGRGHLTLVFNGYRPCHNAQEIIEQAAYEPESDLDHTPDSVFCAHGAGYPVKWYKVPEFMHLPYATSANFAAPAPADAQEETEETQEG
ncbi:GTP-binding protein [Bifidobacterium gallicum DSM 20093 = LMG 11596]|uniref:GTP-binding protein n=1 Tax=Bifidobacterium gallicum DSM 20093 = LMG 11596 TaxID=561180 RepID=A0A087AFV3_9BIFI|nr:GTP-binding protein [Bifidobacterium gallicum DSM 20093 = LMG 11596]